MASESDDSTSCVSFSLRFSYTSAPESKLAKSHRMRRPTSSTTEKVITIAPVVDDDHLASDSSEGSLSPDTRALQRRVRAQFYRRLERDTDRQSLRCLQLSTKKNTPCTDDDLKKEAARRMNDRRSLEVLEAAATTPIVQKMTEQKKAAPSTPCHLLQPRPQPARPPPRPAAGTQLLAGRIYSGTSPFNTPTAAEETTTNFALHAPAPTEPDSDCDSDIFRSDHQGMFLSRSTNKLEEKDRAALVYHWMMVDTIDTLEDEGDDVVTSPEGSDHIHQALFEEVMDLAAVAAAADGSKAAAAMEVLVGSHHKAVDEEQKKVEVVCGGAAAEKTEGAGHSEDSWSPRSVPSQALQGEDEAANEAFSDDEREWLDLGLMTSQL